MPGVCLQCGSFISPHATLCRACENQSRRNKASNPTPDEIRQGCESIQAGWDDAEKARREQKSGLVTPQVEVMVVHEDQVKESMTEQDATKPEVI